MMHLMSGSVVRFRRSLPAEQVEADGYIFFEIRKPNDEVFRLYEFEYRVAMELDGRPLAEVIESVAQHHNLALSEEQLSAFATQLGELGLLEPSPKVDEAELDAPNEFDPLDDAPTAGHGLAALRLAATTLAETARIHSPIPPPQLSGWNEAEPTALMNSMSDLLAVSRARTGENELLAEDEVADADGEDAGPMPSLRSEEATQDIKAGVARPPLSLFDDELAEPAELVAGMGISLPPPIVEEKKRKWWLWAIMAIALAAGVGYIAFRIVVTPAGAPLSVDTILPSPQAVYRWFETTGEMQPPTKETLSLPAGGRLEQLRPAGSKFRAGDVLAITDEGKRQETEIARLRERIAYYQQMLEAMTAESNKGEMHQAEIKLKEKHQLLDEAMAAFSQVAIVAATDGQIESTLLTIGDKARPGDAVLTLKAHQTRAVFKLSHDDAEQAQRLAFCRVLLADAPYDCEFVGTETEDAVVVELPANVLGNPGQAVSLAKARFDGVFSVPNSAVLQVGNTDRVFVAAPSGRVEVRAISIADRSDRETLVAQGLDVGDAVIVDARPDLSASSRVRVAKRAIQ
jgi:hypothetical protein